MKIIIMDEKDGKTTGTKQASCQCSILQCQHKRDLQYVKFNIQLVYIFYYKTITIAL